MNEGPGHVPLNKIPENMAKQLEWCRWAARGSGGGGVGECSGSPQASAAGSAVDTERAGAWL